MKNDAQVEQTIRDYLPDIIHMSLATSADNKPWVCEVHYVSDEDLNLYFRSTTVRRHSQEIAKNPNVAGNIVTQHAQNEKPMGVYFEGTAELMKGVDENHVAFACFRDQLNKGTEILEDAAKEDGHQFYKITVSTFYLFDAKESNPSQKYILKWNGGAK